MIVERALDTVAGSPGRIFLYSSFSALSYVLEVSFKIILTIELASSAQLQQYVY